MVIMADQTRMTARDIRDLMIFAASNMIDKHQTEPESRPRADQPLSLADSRAATAELHRYLERLPDDEPRLVELEGYQLSVEDFIELIPDQGMAPATGNELLDFLLFRAARTR